MSNKHITTHRMGQYVAALTKRFLYLYRNCSLCQFAEHLPIAKEQFWFMLSNVIDQRNLDKKRNGESFMRDRVEYWIVNMVYFDAKGVL